MTVVNPVAEMLLSTPAPAAIWATLMLLCLPAVFLLASPQSVRNPGVAVRDLVGVVRRRAEVRRRLRVEAVEAVRYAEEMRVAADQAGVAARRWRQRLDRASVAAGRAWQAWQVADGELMRLRAAAAWGSPGVASSRVELVERERYLLRVVRAAVGRGDLPAGAVADVVAGRGWDAGLHPFDQDVVVARAVVAYRREVYRVAAAAEAVAAHDAGLAVRSRESLRREFAGAAVRAAEVHHLVPVARPARSSGRRPVLARTA